MATRALFEAWRGKYNDSPRVLSEAIGTEAPEIRRSWVATDPADFPEDVACIPRHRVRHFASLWGCDLLITNDIVTRHLVKGPRVVYLQTWHGSPIKVIGLDETDPKYGNGAGHLKRMRRDVAKWDYLLSPSQAYSDIFRHAFGYEGTILECGYPRNDLLVNDDGTRRREVRDLLNIEDDQLVVLHAPTWRDDAKNSDGAGFYHPSLIDWDLLHTGLGENAVFLNRMHQHVTSDATPVSDRTKDVSDYGDMTDLILASDVLISDYSSLIYDYAVTGKPIILHAPDLRHYRSQVRAFYFDYEAWAPGPITSTTGELVEQLQSLEEVRAQYQRQYSEFVTAFCAYEKGQAASQIVSRLFSDGAL